MKATITWLGHNAWSINTGGHKLLLDPFLNDSPTSPVKAGDVEADFILVSHGHADHVGDTVAIARRTGATVLANFEVGQWLASQGVAHEKIIGMNPGGGVRLPFGHAKFTIAHHSSSMPDGSYGGVPGGFLLALEGSQLYFACDTGLFLEMKQIGAVGLDLAVVPIGDLFTMGPEDSIEAVKLLNPKHVAPCHYNTWPPIAQDPIAWANQVRTLTPAHPVIPHPGESLNLGQG
ncbi:MAG: metal-dependent hydrolase [Pirellulales bacterium]|nr:metal-dependent hydrolase [Pirellulales bacterium]